MPGPEPSREVKLVSRGAGEGAMLTVAESQLRDAGIDLDSFHQGDRPVSAERYVFNTSRADMRLRFKQPEVEGYPCPDCDAEVSELTIDGKAVCGVCDKVWRPDTGSDNQ